MNHEDCEIDVLVAVASSLFGDLSNVLPLHNLEFDGVGRIACVLARHLPMSSAIEQFVIIEPWHDNSEERNQVFETWGITRYLTVSQVLFEEISQFGDYPCDNLEPGKVRHFVVFPETASAGPIIRCCQMPQQQLLPNPTNPASFERLPDKHAFLQCLSDQMSVALLTDLDRLVDVKNRAQEDLLGGRTKELGSRSG